MDKFARRPDARANRRKLFYFLLAFSLPAGCFFALFAFGNAGALWVLGIYAFALTLAVLARMASVRRNHRLWLKGRKIQSEPGPGFSALEAAAISQLLEQARTQQAELQKHLQTSEVVSRYNSGTGSVTLIRSSNPRSVSSAALEPIAWFAVTGLETIVGCRFWPDEQGLLSTMEFFTGGENTAFVDWTRVAFDDAPTGAPRPPVPTTAPVATEPRWIHYRSDV